MATATDTLTLAQWLSPAYPVGAFAYSHGLERAVHDGWVHDTGSLAAWLRDVLRHGAGRSDVQFLAAAYRADTEQDLAGVDATCRAYAGSAERLAETTRLGTAFTRITAPVWGLDLSPSTYPVALGRAARLRGLPLSLTAQMYLHAMLGSLLSAAQRLMPLGQTAAQSLLHDLTQEAIETADESIEHGLDRLSTTSLMAEIAAMRHETQSPRIFAT
ncbi:urease accessory protein UreF [Lutimaribacter marinistellae]|uniref:Urease accessory protein UreF n=1 Tax=Lutimaribacter marinistellae TaxID=1820329 RepID=A0ABV7TLX2_9RHOB